MLSKNGYPKYVLDKCIDEFFNGKFTTKSLFSWKKDSAPKKIFIHLPFLGASSLQICNKLKSFDHKHTDDETSVYIVDALLKIGKNFHFKDKQPLLMKSGIVYKFTCSVDILISVRLGITYLVELKKLLLQKNLKSVNTYFKILPIAWILKHP